MGKDILIIDDDESLCEEIADALRCEGYTVSFCLDGSEGMERAAQGDYDLILLDLKLPGTHGLSILREIKEKGIGRPKVFILSGTPMHDSGLREMDLSEAQEIMRLADAVAGKPFDIRMLLSKIGELTGTHPVPLK
jgi:DNA-binding response OmpR family regulator